MAGGKASADEGGTGAQPARVILLAFPV